MRPPVVMSRLPSVGKQRNLQTWNVFEDVSETFTNLNQHPTLIRNLDLQWVERFIVLMYDRSSAANSVNEARIDLIDRKQRPYNSIPPTQATLREHAQRVAYRAWIIWDKANISNPHTNSPSEWRWTQKGDTWQICWTTLSAIPASCRELIKCSCKKG